MCLCVYIRVNHNYDFTMVENGKTSVEVGTLCEMWLVPEDKAAVPVFAVIDAK